MVAGAQALLLLRLCASLRSRLRSLRCGATGTRYGEPEVRSGRRDGRTSSDSRGRHRVRADAQLMPGGSLLPFSAAIWRADRARLVGIEANGFLLTISFSVYAPRKEQSRRATCRGGLLRSFVAEVRIQPCARSQSAVRAPRGGFQFIVPTCRRFFTSFPFCNQAATS